MARSDMSDLEWEFIKAVLPNKTRGKKRVDDRRVINGIFYVLRTGIPWADLRHLDTKPVRTQRKRCVDCGNHVEIEMIFGSGFIRLPHFAKRSANARC
ncbi:transposase [Celeribacter halophilus]|uniref:Transposase n=1 Tax=Celeribacter halophilus TaxID=576117 RepID=A0AAW7XU85_9RHOB|nr:transposase [Celeribacter halophilus]MDO6457862.1 transposase [Celeribacter halophilus]